MGEAFIRFENVEKIYGSGEGAVRALHDASFTIGKGEICVIVGPSGAGKTTLLNILGGMDTLTSGRVFLNDREVSAFDRRQLADYRRRDIGFVFQFYNLIPNLTALENVELASQIVRDSLPAPQVLTDVGLGERMRNFPAQLSGGEQQRVAIARALAKKPSLLLCDEPTGALDYATGKQILALLQDQSRKNGMTVVIITHNSALTAMADRVIGIRNGTVAYAHLNEQRLAEEQSPRAAPFARAVSGHRRHRCPRRRFFCGPEGRAARHAPHRIAVCAENGVV